MKMLLHVACVLLLSGPADMPGGLAEMVAAERAFARRCAEVGVNASFREFLLPNAIVFVPHPSEAGEVFAGPGNPNALLDWDPVYGDISSTGDLGYLTGPYSLRPRSGDRPRGAGTYFSVWERQADGVWRVVLDAGVEGPTEAGLRTATFQPARTRTQPSQAVQGIQPVDAAEKAFAEDALVGLKHALTRHADPAVRVHRKGLLPISGIEQAASILPTLSRVELETIYLKASGDLAYSYGRFKLSDESTGSGYYVHVWRMNPRGVWKMVYDGWHPLPPPAQP